MAVEQMDTGKQSRTLHVRVVDRSREGHPVVNVRIPVGVVRFGLNIARSFSPQMKDVDVDWDAITAMIEQGDIGKVVEVEDEAAQKTVEVWVE